MDFCAGQTPQLQQLTAALASEEGEMVEFYRHLKHLSLITWEGYLGYQLPLVFHPSPDQSMSLLAWEEVVRRRFL